MKKNSNQESKIIGLRLSPSLVEEVKVEAKRRGMTMNRLFEELWSNYQKRANSKKD